MPPALVIDPGLFSAAEERATHARFNLGAEPGPGLEVNPRPPLWAQENLDIERSAQIFSTAHPHGTTYHEYLHFRIHRQNWVLYQTLYQGELFREAVERLAPRVSDYAGRSALEFASEVYAGLRIGEGRYDEEVLDLYQTILRFVSLKETEV
jgi:hypothetical protein